MYDTLRNEVNGLKINEVEALVGITKKNIRCYEAEGLLAPRRNSDNGYRDYGEAEVETLRRIKLLRKLGVPLEDIRQMLSGAHTVGDGMRRHLVTLERERQNLDAAALLEQMAEMEQSGTTFQNKQSQDIRARYVAPVAVTVLMALLMLGLIWLFLWAFETDPAGAPPLPLLAVFIAVPTVVALGAIVSLVQRIREIGRREIDDARQF